MTAKKLFEQVRGEELDYKIDYSDWLKTDTVLSSTWTIPAELQQPKVASNDTTSTTVWLSGVVLDKEFEVLNQIVTATGRKKLTTFGLTIRR